MDRGTRVLWALVLISMAFNAYFLVSSYAASKQAKVLTERVGMAEWRLEVICGKGHRAALCKYEPNYPTTP